MFLGRPEYPCLPNRGVSLPPARPQHQGKLEPICPQTHLVRGLCVRSSTPGPAQGGLAKRGCGLARLLLLSHFSQEAELTRAAAWAQWTPRRPQTLAALGMTIRARRHSWEPGPA